MVKGFPNPTPSAYPPPPLIGDSSMKCPNCGSNRCFFSELVRNFWSFEHFADEDGMLDVIQIEESDPLEDENVICFDCNASFSLKGERIFNQKLDEKKFLAKLLENMKAQAFSLKNPDSQAKINMQCVGFQQIHTEFAANHLENFVRTIEAFLSKK